MYVLHGKFNRETYLKATATYHCLRRHYVVFEDSLLDMAATKSAGCKILGVLTTCSANKSVHTDMTI